MKHTLLRIAFPLLGLLVMGGCQKEEMPRSPLAEEATHSAAGTTVKQRIAQQELDAFMAQFASLPSGYEAFINQQLPYSVRCLEDLPTGSALARFCPPPPLFADSICWKAVISETDSIAELPRSAWGPQELAMARTMQAAYGGASPNGEAMIGSLIEEDRFPDPDKGEDWEVPTPLEPSHPKFPPDGPRIGPHVVLNEWAKDGDIYVKRASEASSKKGSKCKSVPGIGYTPNEASVNEMIPGYWKHAAIMDLISCEEYGANRCLLSASNRTDTYLRNPEGCIGRVGYDLFYTYWNQADEIGVYRVSAATDRERHGAVEYAQKFYDLPFDFITSRWEDDAFYCSKLVFRAWFSEGYDLEPRVSSFTGKPWDYRLEFERWKRVKRPGGGMIYIPIFRVIWYRDTWVTPTDLTETGHTHELRRFYR